jgi:hypothetical protein
MILKNQVQSRRQVPSNEAHTLIFLFTHVVGARLPTSTEFVPQSNPTRSAAVSKHWLRRVTRHSFYEHARQKRFVATDVVKNEHWRDIYFPIHCADSDFTVA